MAPGEELARPPIYAGPVASRNLYGATSILEVSTALRRLEGATESMEEIASNACNLLRDHFTDKADGISWLPLVRCYVTRRRSQLEPALQDYAVAAGPDAFAERDVVCLALLATAGEEPAWNQRMESALHRAIPLPSLEVLR